MMKFFIESFDTAFRSSLSLNLPIYFMYMLILVILQTSLAWDLCVIGQYKDIIYKVVLTSIDFTASAA